MWGRKSDPTTAPPTIEPGAPMSPLRYALNQAIGTYLIGRLVRELVDLALTQGRALERAAAQQQLGFDVDPHDPQWDAPAPGYFCSGSGTPACSIALENTADSIPACVDECHLAHRAPAVVDLDKPETD